VLEPDDLGTTGQQPAVKAKKADLLILEIVVNAGASATPSSGVAPCSAISSALAMKCVVIDTVPMGTSCGRTQKIRRMKLSDIASSDKWSSGRAGLSATSCTVLVEEWAVPLANPGAPSR